jgi:glycosyltransferase involved in cell wall biosynthesis
MTFSVITPSFQNGTWLKLCLASVADQEVELEHLVQDAGSTDGTLDWLPGDGRAKTVVAPDQGMYDAINRGLRRAKGDILCHLNCDEQYLPGALRAVVAFFQAHPRAEVLFADAVVVDADGQYLWHRKSLVPRRFHTAVLPLSTLTCATFFRRGVVEDRGLWFDPQWRYCGDSDWVDRLLAARVPMAVMRRFTSVFTHTGGNLSLHPNVQSEAARFHSRAPAGAKMLKPLVLAHHRMRRWIHGIYRQKPFGFSLYTRLDPQRRLERRVSRPTSRWRW